MLFRSSMAFRRGDPVTFIHGSYSGETGIVVKVLNDNQYRVQLTDRQADAPESALKAFTGKLNNDR